MIKGLEKQFFRLFGIGPKELAYPDNFVYYPEITDRILLKLICFFNRLGNNDIFKSVNIQELTTEIINETMLLYELAPNEETQQQIKAEVQKLFEEAENERQ